MVQSFTYNGAYANILENDIGSIKAGKQADINNLNQNLFKIPVSEIPITKVMMTVVEGKEVFHD
jgi:predicted amidohydrolase YtcJ